MWRCVSAVTVVRASAVGAAVPLPGLTSSSSLVPAWPVRPLPSLRVRLLGYPHRTLLHCSRPAARSLSSCVTHARERARRSAGFGGEAGAQGVVDGAPSSSGAGLPASPPFSCARRHCAGSSRAVPGGGGGGVRGADIRTSGERASCPLWGVSQRHSLTCVHVRPTDGCGRVLRACHFAVRLCLRPGGGRRCPVGRLPGVPCGLVGPHVTAHRTQAAPRAPAPEAQVPWAGRASSRSGRCQRRLHVVRGLRPSVTAVRAALSSADAAPGAGCALGGMPDPPASCANRPGRRGAVPTAQSRQTQQQLPATLHVQR